MAYQVICTPQVIDLESERGCPHVHPESLNHNANDLSDQGGLHPVRVLQNANVGTSDARGYYNVSMNHQHQTVHNLPPNLCVYSGFIFPSSMYDPSMSTSIQAHVPHTQSFGFPLNQVVPRSMDESIRNENENVNESARGVVKRKNAPVAASFYFINGFARSSSSSQAYQYSPHKPWDSSFESNVLPNVTPFNISEYHRHGAWPYIEGTNGFNSMSANQEAIQHGIYAFPLVHASQYFEHASNTWVSQAANGIAEGVPQWAYINAMAIPGRFAHSGDAEIANGVFHEYQNGPSTMCQGPLPYFHQHAMEARTHFDHTRMEVPYHLGHNNGVLHSEINRSGNRLYFGPRTPAPFNSELTFGPPQHPLVVNPNNRNIRILPPLQRGSIRNFSRLSEVSNVVDEHRDMRLDIDNMTYEELLALEKHIGYVNTGLARSHIIDKLKTSLYVPGTCISDQSSVSSTESDTCIICQEEYRAEDRIGSLDCGHRYHAGCLKQWLAVKNLCPICKTTALSACR